MTDTRRRVKLYALNADRQWDDRGTGHVSSCYVERLKGTSLLVRAESDGSLLLESKIQPDTAYQKQQDTLIVWSEGDNFDLALSFQEKAGCDEIWEKICQVQGKDPSVEITQDIVEESEDERFDEMSDSVQPVELPACEMGRLEDINDTIFDVVGCLEYDPSLPQPKKHREYLRELAKFPLEITLSIDDQKTKTASIDILTYIVEFSPSVVRDYTLQQANNTEEEQMLLNIVIEQMLRDRDPELGGAVQLMGVLRILLDPESMLASVNKSEKADFLNFFYKHSIQTLIAPLLANTTGEKPLKEDYHTVQLLGLVLELLAFCVEHHTYQIKTCILNKDLLRRILVLMRSTHTFLVLGALRFMRRIVALKDDYYNRYIIKGNLFAPVIDAFLRNNGRYNLLDSAILELFEFIKLEDIKLLCSHVVENYGKILEDVEYVQTFKALKTRYDQHQDKLKERDRVSGSVAVAEAVVPSLLRTRYRREARTPDDEEEMWFNDDDELDDEAPLDAAQPHAHAHHALDAIGKIVEKKVCSNTETVNGPSRVLLSTTVASKPTHTDVQGLVDYDGDSDEEEEGGGGGSGSGGSGSGATEERDAKRPRLA
ncbi:unnamed protein product, partial [Iphiclides podalirius]